ncbi:ABC transporter ATP-binding protein [Jiangella endophytica]|uniref:ABC transporter ATP-binding protein n=1 Tax=Jiangella endophytica TaxID=1623398 RepID=UPI000E34695C|nr:ABC transporter ATP-binding protein [Jiangella endophytica]
MLEVRSFAKRYESRGTVTEAVRDVSFSVEQGELLCVVGPSGCGKSTLLRSVAGLDRPTSGEILVNGTPVTEPPENMGVVFQDYSRSLLPWMTVSRNVRLPLDYKVADAGERQAATLRALEAVGLAGFADHYPWQLSGGMQQRVAIARALAVNPTLLLMDEPFASVDAQTRAELEDLLLQVWQEFGMTIVLVTHDIDESVYLGDRVLVLSRPPSTVATVVPVRLPRPRNQLDTKHDSLFADLRTEVLSAIGAHGQSAPAAH